MPATNAVSSLWSWRERQQARQNHERVDTEDAQEDGPPLGEEEQQVERLTQESDAPLVETVAEDGEEGDIENQRVPLETTMEGDSTNRARRSSSRRTVSLSDLEEERDLARRRTSGCVLVAAFILFRLWIQAVATGDFGLLLLCLVGTSWTARFIRHNREREEELDRLIAEYNQNGDGNGEISRNDVRMLSFQAQLALAIIESQRQMMQGGYGNPDGAPATPGVSEEAKERWDKIEFKENVGLPGQTKYGAAENGGENGDEEPHCSICLCEYEEKDELACLPCKHVYHYDCVSSWCSNHQRCPLCNFDLESVTTEEPAAQ
eukprot:scaffold834_cov123-Cylindrotheca_fusiformis.AAC.36